MEDGRQLVRNGYTLLQSKIITICAIKYTDLNRRLVNDDMSSGVPV